MGEASDRRTHPCMAIAVALLLGAGPAAASSWEVTRKSVIDPINSELHRHLPKYLRTRDLGALLELYATDTGTGISWDGAHPVYPGREEETLRWDRPARAEPIRERYQRLLDLLPTIDRAELRIRRVDWRHADGYPAEVRLLVRGMERDGTRWQVDQHARLLVVRRDGQWRIAAEEVTAREAVRRAHPRYEVATERAGVGDVHTNEGSPIYKITDSPGNASGSAVADVDGDGCEDLLLAGQPRLVLYRNGCDGTFTDVTEQAGLPRPYPAPATGVAFFDYDNDGWPDLYVAAAVAGDRLFHNTGGGHFTDVTAAAGIPTGRWASMPIVADYDRDGFLDIYVVRMGDHEKRPPRPNWEAHNGVPNTLLHNNHDGTFTDVTRAAGVANSGWNLAGAWGDYDNDGWPDLYLANEFGSGSLYHNNGNGTFTERAHAAGATAPGAGMGVAWGDYDNDGLLDIYVSQMYANSRWALFHPDFPTPVPWRYRLLGVFTDQVRQHTEQILDQLTRGSTLLHNNGNGTFTDVSDAAGVRDAQWGWGAEFLDYDNDGWLDVYATNGFVTGPIPDDV
jgi:hypothetical protein